jgi:ribosomal protein S12 methylthiotransferase
VDTELMLGLLDRAGYEITGVEQDADVIIVNTCGFITPAKEEAINTILEIACLKDKGRLRSLLVAGCLSQRYGRALLEQMPEVDGVLGIGAVPDIAGIVRRALRGEKLCAVGSPVYNHSADMPRIITTPPYTAYVKIAEGCNNRCSYCAIPSIRGDYRSRDMESVVCEVDDLRQRGVKEVVLVAQDTTAYGLDIYGRRKLAGLLRKLAAGGPPWIRMMYCYPTGFTQELMEVMAEYENICRYVDMPLQHASPGILKLMNRQGTIRQIKDLITGLRRLLPGIAIRSTFMVGFPGETRADFDGLLSFMDEMRFERAGVFKFSPEEGTPAANMPGQVPEELKEERYSRAMELQQQISIEHNLSLVDKVVNVLVEECPTVRSNLYRGRSAADAPEIDGVVYFSASSAAPLTGDLVRVRVTRAYEYDLRGVLVK